MIQLRIRKMLFEDENKTIFSEDEEDQILSEIAKYVADEGRLWDLLTTDHNDILDSAAAIKLGDKIQKALAKVLNRENKTIIKGLDILKKANQSRTEKLSQLKDKFFKMIDDNKYVKPEVKNVYKKAIEKHLANSQEWDEALDSEKEDLSLELNPNDFKPDIISQQNAEEPKTAEEPSVDVGDVEQKTKPQVPKSAKDILVSLSNTGDEDKKKKFKSELARTIRTKGFDLLQRVLEGKPEQAAKKRAEQKREVAEDIDLDNYSAIKHKARDFVLPHLQQALRHSKNQDRDKQLLNQYQNITDRKQQQRINARFMDAIIKFTANKLGAEFLGITNPEPAVEEPTGEIGTSAEDIASRLQAAIDAGDAGELKKIQAEYSGTDEYNKAAAIIGRSSSNDDETVDDTTTVDNIPDEKPETNTEIEPDKEGPQLSIDDEPEGDSGVEPASDLDVGSPIIQGLEQADDAAQFLLDKKLISGPAVETFNQLNDENKSSVVQFAVEKLNNIADSIDEIKTGTLDEASLEDFGFNPEDFSQEDLRDIKIWISSVKKAISAKIAKLLKAQKNGQNTKKVAESHTRIRENVRVIFGTNHLNEITLSKDEMGTQEKVFSVGDVVSFDAADIKKAEKALNRAKQKQGEVGAEKQGGRLKDKLMSKKANAQPTSEAESQPEENQIGDAHGFLQSLAAYNKQNRKIGVISKLEDLEGGNDDTGEPIKTQVAIVDVYNTEPGKLNKDNIRLIPTNKSMPIPVNYLTLIRRKKMIPSEVMSLFKTAAKGFGLAGTFLAKQASQSEWTT